MKMLIQNRKRVLLAALLLVQIGLIGCGSNTVVRNNDVAGGGTEVGNPEKTISLAGSAQKGPFLEGSVVTVYELDEFFNPTGLSFTTATINNMGEYTIQIDTDLESSFVEVHVSGYYFDELTGATSIDPIEISVIAKTDTNPEININTLTSIALPRVLTLIGEGYDFNDAKEQANMEVLDVFEIDIEEAESFEDMNILEEGESNLALVSVSSLVLQIAEDTGDSVSTVIEEIANDIEDNGVLDDAALEGQIDDASGDLEMCNPVSNLEGRFAFFPWFPEFFCENGRFTIDSPISGSLHSSEEPILFTGSSDDLGIESKMVWYSNLNGEFGHGPSFEKSDLSPGFHMITLTYEGSDFYNWFHINEPWESDTIMIIIF